MTGTKESRATARIVAAAIRNSRKFNASEHETVMKGLMDLMAKNPTYANEVSERIVQIGNRSAFSKDMAKAGIVSEGEPSAWVREIAEELDAIAEEEKAEMAKLTAKK